MAPDRVHSLVGCGPLHCLAFISGPSGADHIKYPLLWQACGRCKHSMWLGAGRAIALTLTPRHRAAVHAMKTHRGPSGRQALRLAAVGRPEKNRCRLSGHMRRDCSGLPPSRHGLVHHARRLQRLELEEFVPPFAKAKAQSRGQLVSSNVFDMLANLSTIGTRRACALESGPWYEVDTHYTTHYRYPCLAYLPIRSAGAIANSSSVIVATQIAYGEFVT